MVWNDIDWTTDNVAGIDTDINISLTLQKTVFQALRFRLNSTKEFQCNSNGSLHIDNIRLSISENMLSVKCIEKSSDINLRFTITLTLEEK